MKQKIQRDALVLNRRELIKAFGLGAAAIMLPATELLSSPARAQVTGSPADVITRRIPRTNEVLPAIGLGTFLTFDSVPGQKTRQHSRGRSTFLASRRARVRHVSALWNGRGESRGLRHLARH